MRMLDNCSLETDKVKTIQDDLNYYVDENQVGGVVNSRGVVNRGVCVLYSEARLCVYRPQRALLQRDC